MKRIFSVLFVLMTALLLVACGDTIGKDGEIIDFSEQYGQKSIIRVWIDDEEGDYMKEIIKEFNKLYPDIEVEHQHKGSIDSREHLKTFGPSGNGADVFQFPHDHLSTAVLEDLVLPLPNETKDRLAERAHELGMDIATLYYDEETGSFDPNNENAVERLYAVPMSIEAVGLYYNKEYITTPAETYEELIAAAKVWNETEVDGRTNAQNGDYYLGTSSHWADSYFIQHIYSAFDFTPFGPELNDPKEVGFEKLDKALLWMRDELKPVTTGTGDTDSIGGGGKFEEGKIPYVIAGPWNMEAYKGAGIDFGIAKLPSINGKETKPYAGAMMAAVYKYSKNQADAIKFVEFLNSDIAMELQYEYKTKLPALKTELLTDNVREDKELMAMSEQLENAVPMPTIPEVEYFWGPGEAMVKEIWNADKDIKAALREAEESYKTLAGLVS